MQHRPQLERTWTILEIIRWGTEYFRSHGIDGPRLTIELLVCHVLDVGRVRLYADFDRPLTKDELGRLRTYIQRRVHHEPLQYITGKAYFYGLELDVTPDVLIPRPETEVLVDLVRNWITRHPGARTAVDLGTGSGCIPIAVASHHPTVTWTAVDVSDGALAVAERNVLRHGLQGSIRLLQADVLKDPPPVAEIITMNPPYIAAHDMPDLEPHVRDYEPHIALTDDADGLTFYRTLASFLPPVVRYPQLVIVEVGWQGARDVAAIFSGANTPLATSITSLTIHKDLSGVERFVTIERGNEDHIT